jgi:hypothetical protein
LHTVDLLGPSAAPRLEINIPDAEPCGFRCQAKAFLTSASGFFSKPPVVVVGNRADPFLNATVWPTDRGASANTPTVLAASMTQSKFNQRGLASRDGPLQGRARIARTRR